MDVYGNTGSGNINVPGMLKSNCYLLFGGFVMIFTYVFHTPRMIFLQNIMVVSSNIPAESFNRIAKFVHAKDLLGFIFLIVHLPNAYAPEIHTSLRVMTYLYITMVVYLADMQYINCVFVIKICFESVDKTLKSLEKTMVNEEPHLLRRNYHEQNNELLLMKLRNLQKHHHQVSDVLKKLNSTYGLHAVATVIMTFSEITFILYFFILKLLDQHSNVQEQIWDFNLLLTMMFYILKLILIVWVCEKGKTQAKQIGSTVHDVLLNTFDLKIKEELHLFSLQLLHRKNVFYARGLAIDSSLLNEIAGAITMYLLILIQFHLSAASCKT
ncbi:putative gustatory receptor 2a [Belonocnema kinseyi]|uniref:putative gustatory receptor 2a n=1 Tax=Belonocnema kinseyi TaxID=2817044 RepID=UPI00143CD7A9|nr:putative gustatory receptor 2a [Belonocnema kinseyi]